MVTVAQEHNVVVVGEIVVGDGDRRRAHHGVDEAVLATRQGAVVDPYVMRPEDGDSVAVRFGAVPVVLWTRPHHCIT